MSGSIIEYESLKEEKNDIAPITDDTLSLEDAREEIEKDLN